MRSLIGYWLKPAEMQSWNHYWFRPAPVFDLAMVRIVAVATQVALLLWFENYTIERLQIYAELDAQMYFAHPLFRLLTLPFGLDFRPDLDFLVMTRYVAIVSGFLAIIGLLTNVSLAVFVYTNLLIILHYYSYGDFHHTEAPLILVLIFITLSPAGRVLSVDRFLFGRRPDHGVSMLDETSPYARWPIQLAQWMFALIYLSAFLEKLVFIGGLDWVNGYTLQYHMAHNSLWRGSLVGMWMQQHWWLLQLGQIATVVFQGTFWLSLVFPRLKWFYVPVGFSFHVLILIALNAIFFEWMGAYAVFVPWAAAASLLLRGSTGRRHVSGPTTSGPMPRHLDSCPPRPDIGAGARPPRGPLGAEQG